MNAPIAKIPAIMSSIHPITGITSGIKSIGDIIYSTKIISMKIKKILVHILTSNQGRYPSNKGIPGKVYSCRNTDIPTVNGPCKYNSYQKYYK